MVDTMVVTNASFLASTANHHANEKCKRCLIDAKVPTSIPFSIDGFIPETTESYFLVHPKMTKP
jgi:hypothetical protein